jgi:hypothetical protein
MEISKWPDATSDHNVVNFHDACGAATTFARVVASLKERATILPH